MDCEPGKLLAYSNRFATSLHVLRHLLKPIGKKNSTHVLLAVICWLESEESQCCTSKECSVGANSVSHGISALLVCYKNAEILLGAFTVYCLLRDVIELTVMSSATTQHTDATLMLRLQALHSNLSGACNRTSKLIVTEALALLASMGIRISSPEIIQSVEERLKTGATSGLKAYSKHITPALQILRNRFQLDPRNEPVPFPGIPDTQHTSQKDIESFFDCYSEPSPNLLLNDYNVYVKNWESIPLKKRELGICKFWEEHSADYPYLSKVGIKHSQRILSSIAAERTFATMRTMEDPSRMSMGKTAFCAELESKINNWLVDELFEEYASKIESIPC